MDYTAETVVVRRRGEMKKRLAIVSAMLIAVAACVALAASYSSQAAKPSIESMYHMWLGPNGLPLSPRKQRGLLFQFCTTNFVSALRMLCICVCVCVCVCVCLVRWFECCAAAAECA